MSSSVWLQEFFHRHIWVPLSQKASSDTVTHLLSESLDLYKRVSQIHWAYLSVAVGCALFLLLIIIWVIWRFRATRYNEFWGLKKSVHFWQSLQTSAQPYYCSACRQLICGFWIFRNIGWECVICNRTSHMRCLAACDRLDCKCPSQPEPLRHQFVEGNLPSDAICGVCGIICASPFGLHGLRCLWCGRTVHEDCLTELPEVCDLGPFRRSVLPPSLVRLDVQLPTSFSSSREIASAFTNSFNAFFSSKTNGGVGSSQLALTAAGEAGGVGSSAVSTTTAAGGLPGYSVASMKAQLAQVQGAMATKVSEGLREVTGDIQRLNQRFRRKLQRALLKEQALPAPDPTDINTDGSKGSGVGEKPGHVSSEITTYTTTQLPTPLFSNNLQKRTASVPASLHALQSLKSVAQPTRRSQSARCSRKEDRGGGGGSGAEPVPLLSRDTSSHSIKKKTTSAGTGGRVLHTRRRPRRRNDEEDEAKLSDRLFELARLMPAKADVWVINVRFAAGGGSGGVPAAGDLTCPIGTTGSLSVPTTTTAGVGGSGVDIFSKSILGSSSLFQSSIPPALTDKRVILIFVNGKSGGQLGGQLLRQLYRSLNPVQVVDIQSDAGPGRALKQFRELAAMDRLRVAVCGGDGTVGWVMQEIRRLFPIDSPFLLGGGGSSTNKNNNNSQLPTPGSPVPFQIPVGILPLGTGNDLARVLGWGNDFDGDLSRFLSRMENAKTTLVDYWRLQIYDNSKIQGSGVTGSGVVNYNNKNVILDADFNNYMDVGVAARIALKFHDLRNGHPELFQSQLGNRFLYGEMGVREWVTEKTLNLGHIKIWCDGLPVVLPERKIEGLIVVNIPSFSGGVNLWRSDTDDRSGVGTSPNNDFYDWINKRHPFLNETVTLAPSSTRMKKGGGGRELHNQSSKRRSHHHRNSRSAVSQTRWASPEACPHGVDISARQTPVRRYARRKSSSLGSKACKGRAHEQRGSEAGSSTVSSSAGDEGGESGVVPDKNTTPSTKQKVSRSVGPSSRRAELTTTIEAGGGSGVGNLMVETSDDYSRPLTHHHHDGYVRRWQRQSFRDEIIEVVAVRSLFHLAQIQVGLAEPLKVCQGREIEIEIPIEVPFQIDGEPRVIPAHSRVKIAYKGKSFLLSPVRSHEDAPLSTVSEVLDAAVRDQILTPYQRNCLFWELSKRL